MLSVPSLLSRPVLYYFNVNHYVNHMITKTSDSEEWVNTDMCSVLSKTINRSMKIAIGSV